MVVRGRPPKVIKEWPYSPPPLGEPGTASKRCSKVIDILVGVADGKLASSMARRRWPDLLDSSPNLCTTRQQKLLNHAMREVVKIWLGTHARNIDWKILVLGSAKQNNRVHMKATATAHENAARHIRSWVDNLRDTDAADRAATAINALPGDQRVAEVRDLPPDPDMVTGEMVHEACVLARKRMAGAGPSKRQNDLIERLLQHADEFDRVAKDIREWLTENAAQGGTNLAAREIAQIVAKFFDDAYAAAATFDRAMAAALPAVEFRRRRRMVFDIPDGHVPYGSFCLAIEAILRVLGLDEGSWQRAVKAVCDERKIETESGTQLRSTHS